MSGGGGVSLAVPAPITAQKILAWIESLDREQMATGQVAPAITGPPGVRTLTSGDYAALSNNTPRAPRRCGPFDY